MTTTLETLQKQHLEELEAQTQDRTNIVVELRSEIETLHAEHAHDIASTQSDLLEKSSEIIHLNKLLAETTAKAQQKLAETQHLHQMTLDTQAHSFPPNVVADLRSEISSHLIRISHLTNELSDAQTEAEDAKMLLKRSQQDLALRTPRYQMARNDISSLINSKETIQQLHTELSDLREDIYYHFTLLDVAKEKAKAHHILRNTQWA